MSLDGGGERWPGAIQAMFVLVGNGPWFGEVLGRFKGHFKKMCDCAMVRSPAHLA